jgi:hypothetical protein
MKINKGDKLWILKNKTFWFLILSLLIFIVNQILMAYKPACMFLEYYLKYASPIISIVSSGFFIALLVYFCTVTKPERKQTIDTLAFLLGKYYEMKESVLSEILIIIGEQGEPKEGEIIHDPIEAKKFFNAGKGKERGFREYRLLNELTGDSSLYEDINRHLQNFYVTLNLFTNNPAVIKYDLVSVLSRYTKAISIDHAYIKNGPEMGGDQYKPFMRTLYFIFTGYELGTGHTESDYFAIKIKSVINTL